jgi:hypothetical protein
VTLKQFVAAISSHRIEEKDMRHLMRDAKPERDVKAAKIVFGWLYECLSESLSTVRRGVNINNVPVLDGADARSAKYRE